MVLPLWMISQDVHGFFYLSVKSEVYDIFKLFAKRSENEFELKIKRVISDNRSEFRNSKLNKLCDDMGIKHELSTKYTPQFNGLVERKNKTLNDTTRSMLNEYNVTNAF